MQNEKLDKKFYSLILTTKYFWNVQACVVYRGRNRLPESSVTALKRLKKNADRRKSENATYSYSPCRRVVLVFCRSITWGRELPLFWRQRTPSFQPKYLNRAEAWRFNEQPLVLCVLDGKVMPRSAAHLGYHTPERVINKVLYCVSVK